MNIKNELATSRLILRQWKDSDLPIFAEMNSSEKVMKYFPKLLSEMESNAFASRLVDLIEKRGWGLWAVELKESSEFIGYTGLHDIAVELSFSPAVEIGWRLSDKYWGKGYATEAAKKVLCFAFNEIGLDEILSITSVINYPSRAVMERINMTDSVKNFFHPSIPDDSPLKEHVLYKITKSDWLKNNPDEK